VTTPAPPRRRVDPLLFVVLGVAAGIFIAAIHRPQVGTWVVCASLAVAAVLRLVLLPRDAGLLVVRSRRVDVMVLAGLATAVGVLAAVTPFPTSGG
jgi:Protein of unknown function (DUF3017)